MSRIPPRFPACSETICITRGRGCCGASRIGPRSRKSGVKFDEERDGPRGTSGGRFSETGNARTGQWVGLEGGAGS